MLEDKKISNSEESLSIITQMIQSAKVDIRAGSFYYLLWGWLIILILSGIFFLEKFTGVTHTERLWLLIIIGFVVSAVYGYNQGRNEKSITYAGRLYMWTWLGFAISYAGLVFLLISGKQYGYIGPVVLILAGYATFLSGIIIKFRPLIMGAVLFWVLGVVAWFVHNEFTYLVEALAILSGYLIPGYMLKSKKENESL